MLDDFKTELNRIGGRVMVDFDRQQSEGPAPRLSQANGSKIEINTIENKLR
jgi:hypothetical protein